MKTTMTFTSTLSPELLKWVDSIARAEKRTRRGILEEAIKHYQRQLASDKLRRAFESIADDPEIVEMAEWGMKDYARMLKDFDA